LDAFKAFDALLQDMATHARSNCVLHRRRGGCKIWNSRNPPKFTKSSVYINQIPLSATKSTYMKRKLSKSNVISHKINGFHEIQ